MCKASRYRLTRRYALQEVRPLKNLTALHHRLQTKSITNSTSQIHQRNGPTLSPSATANRPRAGMQSISRHSWYERKTWHVLTTAYSKPLERQARSPSESGIENGFLLAKPLSRSISASTDSLSSRLMG